MRLMQAMAGAPRGGAEAFFARLAAAFEDAGSITQRVVIARDRMRAAQLREARVDLVELPFGGRLDLWTPLALRRSVVDFRPDILLTWMNRATLMAPNGKHVLVGRLGGYYDLKYYRRCDHLICNTPDLVRHVTEGGWSAARATYLPNFATAPKGAPLARADHGIPKDALLLLGMGRLHHNKGFDTLLAAMPDLPHAWLMLAGSGPEEAGLRREARALGVEGRVRFLGWQPDVGPLLRACDIFVCPSRHEPFGNVVLEAWAAKRPVIATAAAGPRHLIVDGKNGILVPVDEPRAMAEAVKLAARRPDKMAALAAAGHATYERDYSETVVVRRYLDFFQRVKKSCAASRG